MVDNASARAPDPQPVPPARQPSLGRTILRHTLNLFGVVLIGIDSGSFWSQMQASVDIREDILQGVVKSFVQAQLRDMGAPFWQRNDECDAFVIANHFLSEQGFQFVGVKGAA